MKITIINENQHNLNLIYRCLLNGGYVTWTTRTQNNVGLVVECPAEEFPIYALMDRPFKSFVLTPQNIYFESFSNIGEARKWLGSEFGEGKFIDLT